MGYYSIIEYAVLNEDFTPASIEVSNEVFEFMNTLAGGNYYIDGTSGNEACSESIKAYDLEDDMLTVSEKFPFIFLIVDRFCEEPMDLVRYVFHNGFCKDACAVHWPDPSEVWYREEL